ncbi:MAG: hypothetical protein LBD96_02965 [Treponema sp.]|jgi:hypothetical protein|nr:hypothetical protein [Treponema sp.]
MKKKTCFLSGMAVLALAIFTFSAVPAGAQTPSLLGTVWQGDIGRSLGISRIDFDPVTNDAVGQFGDYNVLYYTYVFDPSTGDGTLFETKTKYESAFNLAGNTLTFPNGIRPFGQTQQVFAEITILTNVALPTLAGTLWIGKTSMGESLLDQITYNQTTQRGTLRGSFGPNTPVIYTYTYDYTPGPGLATGTGEGTIIGLGDFTTDDATATLTIPDFMGLGTSADFELFEYLP